MKSVVLPVATLLLVGCSALPRFDRPRPEPRTDRTAPIAKALDYVLQTQWTEHNVLHTDRPWVGNWPQTVDVAPLPAVVDIASGFPAYIHHVLCHVTPSTAPALGLSDQDVVRTQAARRRAIRMMRQFQEPPGRRQAAFGWWPRARFAPTPARLALARLTKDFTRGPAFRGVLAPATSPAFPKSHRIWPDSDSTCYIHASLHLDALLDGGAGAPQGLGDLLASRRDLPGARRTAPAWVPRGSGVFLTWFDEPNVCAAPNEVDLCVLANCVWGLARAGATDTPGFAESVALLNRATRERRYLCPREMTGYYTSPYSFHYLVARACIEGPVPELSDALNALADDVERRARHATWPGRTPCTNATCAINTLVYAGRRGPLVDAACRALACRQDPRTGAWPAEPVVYGTSNAGQVMRWRCRAGSTAAAMQALILAKLGPVLGAPQVR